MTPVFKIFLGAVTGFFLVTHSGIAAEPKTLPKTRNEVQLSYAPLVKKTAPAVVNIYARKIVRERGRQFLFNDPFFRRFFGEDFGQGRVRKRIQKSLGSGVIVRADGLVITNKHVVEGADEINVVLSDRREFSASLVISDDRTDLAVLRVDTGKQSLPFLELADSDSLEVGDLVLAIGNPFGVGQTVTSGIVSALARTRVARTDLNFFIQTDAAINPGNSGGALVGMNGKLAGINTAIFSKSGGSLGIGFAIPSNMVRAVINGITEDGRLVRGWLGAAGQGVSQDIATSLSMPRPTGVLISKVYKGAAAEAAGLRVGDVVLSINGHKVDDPKGLQFRIATISVNETVELSVWRRHKPLALRMKVTPPPDTPAKNVTDLKGQQPLTGTRVANLSPAFAIEIGSNPFASGVMIVDLLRGSPANRFGFQVGDIVANINGVKVRTVGQLKGILNEPVDR
ncbi:MAG: Do family serine endopeptidase, partial [Alphaproteobacteria bacterium]|nr:Do family serine endopeptidase [Alphaproteobacteria bacterium]